MTDRDSDDDLAEVAEELAGELRRLREELDEQRRGPPRGPLGIPRPPSPREFAQFADEVAIPGLIAILEANITLLETLQKAIRLADSERRARERSREVGSEAADRAGEVSRQALDRLQSGLDDLRGALEGDALPEDRVGGDLLEDIERLQADIDERIDESRRDREGVEERTESGMAGENGTEGSVGEETNGSGSEGPQVDVDAELDSLRERYGEEDDDADDED